MELSLVVPSYNEEKNVEKFYKVAVETFKNIKNYEIIFINDGSKDNTLFELKKLIKDKKVKVISFSRNFGKESAMLAGLEASSGKYVCVIDADLQQNPKYVLKMLDILKKDDNLDVVAAFQKERKEGKILTFFKNCFYNIIGSMSEVKFKQGASDFRLFTRKVIKSILELNEHNRFSKGIFSWVGYNTYYLEYEVETRKEGTSAWSFNKLFNYAIEGIVSFTVTPLRITFFLAIISFLIGLLLLILYFVLNLQLLTGITSIILLVSSFNFLVLGIISEYLSKIYIESKDRPHYIIREKINFDKE